MLYWIPCTIMLAIVVGLAFVSNIVRLVVVILLIVVVGSREFFGSRKAIRGIFGQSEDKLEVKGQSSLPSRVFRSFLSKG